MKKITGVLSGCLMFFTAAVAAAGAGTIEMASGLAGPNLKNLAAERSTRYALMVSYPLGLTAQPTILDMTTGKTGQKCGVDKKCKSPFDFRTKGEQQRLNDELQQAANDYVADVYPAATAVADVELPKIYFGDLYSVVLWRLNNEQCLTVYSLTLDHEWESCEKIAPKSVVLRSDPAVNIETAITETDAKHILLLNQGLVGNTAFVDVKGNRLVAPCGEVKCKSSRKPVALQETKSRRGNRSDSVQVLAEDTYTSLISKGSVCTTIIPRSSGEEYEVCSPPAPKFWRP